MLTIRFWVVLPEKILVTICIINEPVMLHAGPLQVCGRLFYVARTGHRSECHCFERFNAAYPWLCLAEGHWVELAAVVEMTAVPRDACRWRSLNDEGRPQ